MKNSLLDQCLNILKKKDIQDEIKVICRPLIELLIQNIYTYIYLFILLVLLIFILILLNFILQIYILLRLKPL